MQAEPMTLLLEHCSLGVLKHYLQSQRSTDKLTLANRLSFGNKAVYT